MSGRDGTNLKDESEVAWEDLLESVMNLFGSPYGKSVNLKHRLVSFLGKTNVAFFTNFGRTSASMTSTVVLLFACLTFSDDKRLKN